MHVLRVRVGRRLLRSRLRGGRRGTRLERLRRGWRDGARENDENGD